MIKIKKNIDLFLNIIICFLSFIYFKQFYLNYLFLILTLIFLYYYFNKDYNNKKKITIINICLFIILCFINIEMLGSLINQENLNSFIKSYKQFGFIIYFIICFLQPIILPIPEAVTLTSGSFIFGPLLGFILGFLGTILGIYTMFILTRFGKYKLKISDNKYIIKYNKLISKNESFILILLFIFPILPDEFICIGAGLSKINFKKFALIAFISKLLTTIFYSIISNYLKILLDLNYIYQIIIILIVIIIYIIYKQKKDE